METKEKISFSNPHQNLNILYFADKYDQAIKKSFAAPNNTLTKLGNIPQLKQKISQLSIYEMDVILMIEVKPEEVEVVFELNDFLKENWITRNLITIFLLTKRNLSITKKAFKARISDCYNPDIDFDNVKIRCQYLMAYKNINEQVKSLANVPVRQYKMPLIKRLLDLTACITAVMLLSPVFVLIAVLIKLDSKGPIFYISKRVGAGYNIFNFYKFRSMRSDADKEVEALKSSSNQYGDSVFFKMKNDPRVTKLGNFLRNSSLDELPQLFNVIKGDMSLVGNRPLPLYEAELLTTDEWSTRFLGPAGITGLWQITKRGKSDMSDRERKKLDNFYINNFSIWLDLKIIFMTIPVLFQKEKV